MAWGDRYVAELFDVTLAAALAPGNLPAVVELLDCDVVILTETARFDRLREHPVFRGIQRLCPVELRPVDEFVTRPDAYGMALTYALFRGFEDFGQSMVNVHLLFLNSDFVLADGSFRTVAQKILAGERLILAPSYCVVGEVVGPELDRWRDSETSAITVSPRELAAVGIPNRHNTIRGKTINQQLFSMEWIDQFYWLVDQETILAHQLPIAVVSMRPERVLTEMVTFWDYGIISQACPTTPRCVIADSDEFLMIELRSADTAREQIRLGRPSHEQIARKLYRFITADPIELARHTLVWHSADLPPDLSKAQAELDRYVSEVVSYLPKPMDYRDHYIWRYHYPTFHKLRGAYLASKGTPLSWNVDELVEYPPHPAEAVLDAEFVAASAGIARHTASALSADGGPDVSAHIPPSAAGLPDLEPVWQVLENDFQVRALILNSRNLPMRLVPPATGLPVEFEGLPASMDASVAEGRGQASAARRFSRLSVDESSDLCLCEIDAADFLNLRGLVQTLSHLMRSGSKIYIFFVNPKAGPLALPTEIIASDALALEFPSRVMFVGAQPGLSPAQEGSDTADRAEPAALARQFLKFLRADARRRAADPRLAVFDAPPDQCLGMVAEIDVTLRHSGPFLVIKPRASDPVLALATIPIDTRRAVLSADRRTAQELASKLALVSAEKDSMTARVASLEADMGGLSAKLAAVQAERARQSAEWQTYVQRAAAERGTLRSYLSLLEAKVLGGNTTDEYVRVTEELCAVRTAFSTRIEELEDHNRILTEEATERARQLQERAETDYQILMAQQQLLAGMQDADPAFLDIYRRCKDFTMTSVERLYALYKSVEYIVGAGLEGDFVETGVWRGGSCMLIAETLIALGDTSRRIFLFDTFEGHPKPDAEKDVDVWGNRAVEEWERREAAGETWAYVSLDEARANMVRTGYPTDRIVFVKGMVEDTIPETGEIGALSLLRLDTDWYGSASASLKHLFPRLVEGGVLIMDDYGHYKGQRRALDEYLAATGQHLLLNRIDYSCRVAVKIASGSRGSRAPAPAC